MRGPWPACQSRGGEGWGACLLGHERRNTELPDGNAELSHRNMELPITAPLCGIWAPRDSLAALKAW